METNSSLDFFNTLQAFSAATNFSLVVVNRQGQVISDFSSFSTFCQKVRSKPAFKSRCQQCHAIGELEAYQDKKVCMYRCHAGLVNVSLPIILNNHLMGAISFGQIDLKEDEENQIPQLQPTSTRWQFYPDLRQARKQKTVTKTQLEAATSLLETIIDYQFKAIDPRDQMKFTLPTLEIEKQAVNDPKKAEISKAITYINKNFTSDLTIKDVADHVYLSPFHFSRVFKKEIQVPFNTYLIQRRVKQAKILLTHSDLSVNAISKEIGFSQTSYFCKIFRSFVGTTPARYRKKIIS